MSANAVEAYESRSGSAASAKRLGATAVAKAAVQSASSYVRSALRHFMP